MNFICVAVDRILLLGTNVFAQTKSFTQTDVFLYLSLEGMYPSEVSSLGAFLIIFQIFWLMDKCLEFCKMNFTVLGKPSITRSDSSFCEKEGSG